MKKLKLIFQSIYSINAIYELRKTPILITLIVGMVLGIVQLTPFVFRFFDENIYRFDQSSWELDEDDRYRLVSQLPDSCLIRDGLLTCAEFEDFQVNEEVSILFFHLTEDLNNGIAFMENHLIFAVEGQHYMIPYQATRDSLYRFEYAFDAIGLEQWSVVDFHLFAGIANGLRANLIVPFVLKAYQTGILTFFIYTGVVAAMSMLLKFGHTNFLSFKEVFSIIIYSSSLPIVAVLIVGIVTPAFSTIIYNMGTPLVAYFVYRNKVVPKLYR